MYRAHASPQSEADAIDITCAGEKERVTAKNLARRLKLGSYSLLRMLEGVQEFGISDPFPKADSDYGEKIRGGQRKRFSTVTETALLSISNY